MTSDTNELNDARYYEYDAAGNLTEYTDRNGRVTQYAYDNLQRRTTETWLDGVTTVNTISYGYDAASQLVSVTDASAAYDFTYDRLGRITSTEYDLAALGYDVVLDQAYDALNRRIRLAAEIDGTDDLLSEYAYDFLNRMTQVTQAGQTGGNTVAEKRVDFTYDADDKYLLTSAARYADLAGTELIVTGLYTYNNFDKLSILKYQDATSTDIAEYQWGYDIQGRVSGVYIIGHGSENYRYDGTDQITRTTDNSTYTTTNFTYDDNGNRIDGSRTIGDNNQILSDGTYNYAYDDEGNITLRTNIADGSYTVYEWDHRNRLASVTDYDVSDAKQQQIDQAYDPFNNLIGRALDSDGDGAADESSYFIYDEGQILLQLDDSGDVEHRMLWGPQVDQILADENEAGDVYWMLTDNQNTVRDIAEYDDATDTTSIVNHIAYSVFGEVTSQTNSSLDALPFYYTARYFDAATGLQYNTNRWYNPELNRWMSQDPIGFDAGDANLYRYVGNGFTNAVDPSGLEEEAVQGPFSYLILIFNGELARREKLNTALQDRRITQSMVDMALGGRREESASRNHTKMRMTNAGDAAEDAKALVETYAMFCESAAASATPIGKFKGESAAVRPRSARITGQLPQVRKWVKNFFSRSEDEILGLLRKNGIEVPDDVAIFVGEADEFIGTIDDIYDGKTVLTAKLPPLEEDRLGYVYFKDMYSQGKIPIQISPEMMKSDEAILAVLQHELHELALFRAEFAANNGKMKFFHFRNEAMPGNPGNFHCQAWDAADELIRQVRGEK
ncbi:RHS repeat domain-containing protein [Blastopirellula retiformator]|uniref:tRNA nuclease WapA n=1 Tax=Blastopirellula retiformator TaxID=2527970 RepID=A0A5C5UU71_9BACT|nr:RHS repeat-associated core domain-containing protein [Blastopirellula retiformator]TWT29628.1 tRNA nuclease WapA precursor [Blastopirellula retiformator]